MEERGPHVYGEVTSPADDLRSDHAGSFEIVHDRPHASLGERRHFGDLCNRTARVYGDVEEYQAAAGQQIPLVGWGHLI
jgi:hypothetical protein